MIKIHRMYENTIMKLITLNNEYTLKQLQKKSSISDSVYAMEISTCIPNAKFP